MNDNIKISIIVPVYNREKTINRCIDSVLGSPYKNIELIIVDDESTDASWDIIQSYTDSRIKPTRIKHGGVTVARNTGLNMATGEYIHFVDSDDFIESDIYAACIDVMKELYPDIIMFDSNVYFESQGAKYKGAPVALPQNKLLDQQYIRENILPVLVNLDGRRELFIAPFVWNKFFKRCVIEKNFICFDESRQRWEDRLFQIWFLRFAETFYYIPHDGYNYVQGTSSFANNYDKTVFNMVLNGDKDYVAIVGDLYEFNNEYSKNYYPKVFIDTALRQFVIRDIDKIALKNDIGEAVLTARARELFTAFTSSNEFEKEIKDAILDQNSDQVFDLLNSEYLRREQEKTRAAKNQNSIPRRIYRRLKAILK